MKKRRRADINISWVLFLLVILTIVSGIASFFLSKFEWASAWLMNISSELIGAVITYILFELIIGRAEKRNEEERHKIESQLRLRTRLLQSNSFEEKQLILDEINALGVMRGSNLMYSNLKGIFLSGVDMQDVDFSWSDLSGANMSNANLEGANLSNANLKGAILIGANFKGAIFANAELQHATVVNGCFDFAILKNANFQFANLENSSFFSAITEEIISNEYTIMPNGQKHNLSNDWDRYVNMKTN
jgi:uncharacterized protein YjbI with pentapeptide repeats